MKDKYICVYDNAFDNYVGKIMSLNSWKNKFLEWGGIKDCGYSKEKINQMKKEITPSDFRDYWDIRIVKISDLSLRDLSIELVDVLEKEYNVYLKDSERVKKTLFTFQFKNDYANNYLAIKLDEIKKQLLSYRR